MSELMKELTEDARWYCPFYTELQHTARSWSITCEGGCRVAFEALRRLDDYADRYCRGEGYRDCSVARSRFARWGVDPDER